LEAGFSSQISVGISAGKPATIRLSLNQVGALAITLPGLVDKALRTRYGDQSLRYAYPLASWVVEQSSDPTHGMVALRTVDGFQRLLLDPARAAERTRGGAGRSRRPRLRCG
jgi:hypothetical protein